jgi:hypothetical protein
MRPSKLIPNLTSPSLETNNICSLATNHTLERHEIELQRYFSQFGHCIIKVKNKDGLPMAFVQFTVSNILQLVLARYTDPLITGTPARHDCAWRLHFKAVSW